MLLLFVSCAKVSYIVEQGVGQISLEVGDIDNEDFLKDPKQDEKNKKKVKTVVQAKNYFYHYFSLKKNPIYDEVKILDQKAVTYLVIHSPINKIEAIKEWFPIMGEFPYLGFFSKNSALDFVQEKKDEGYATYMRPVYAYSTLNHPLWPFYDNILSSFFIYTDEELTELIFHELVHTIIFVSNQVRFNENLANFISEEMVKEYYQFSEEKIKLEKLKIERRNQLKKLITDKTKILSEKYTNSTNPSLTLKEFLERDFLPSIKKKCSDLKIEFCWPLKGEWNNARFAAIGTYEASKNELNNLYQNYGKDLKSFVLRLKEVLSNYDDDIEIYQYLKKEL